MVKEGKWGRDCAAVAITWWLSDYQIYENYLKVSENRWHVAIFNIQSHLKGIFRFSPSQLLWRRLQRPAEGKEGELSPRQEVTRCSGEGTATQLLVLETWDGKARVDQICSLKEKMLARDIKRYSPLGLNQNKLSIQQDITSSAIVRVSKLRREIWRNEVSEAMSKLKRG